MLESNLMQFASGIQQQASSVSSQDGLAVLIGLLATALPTISLVLRNYYNGKLKYKGEELIEAGKKVVNQEKVINDFTPLLTKLIVANNDGRISQKEYNVIISEAESKLLLYSKETGIDLAGLITTLRLLMEKRSSPSVINANGKERLVGWKKEVVEGGGNGAATTAMSMAKKPKIASAGSDVRANSKTT
jgi:hypothetical protein